jgi:2-dehydro-3-deoxy-D-arabinonate dehydratase
MRRRVKEQLKKIAGLEYWDTSFSYAAREGGQERYVTVPESGGGSLILEGSLAPGSVYTIGTDVAGRRLALLLPLQDVVEPRAGVGRSLAGASGLYPSPIFESPMQLCKVQRPDGKVEVGVLDGGSVRVLPLARLDGPQSLSDMLHSSDPDGLVQDLLDLGSDSRPADSVRFLAPLDQQEVWAAGVTYKRSSEARMRESADTGGARFYDLVYSAERPELFFKAPARRVVDPGSPVRIRRDAKWSVPEPELALVVSPGLKIVGYTIGNDMSSRDIEGENPLYLPQAKFYDGACAVGPVVTLASAFPPPEQVTITLTIQRAGATVFQGTTGLSALKRSPEELVSWLGRETSFPDGAVLLTGTGIVPPDDFTLAVGDDIAIEIAGIGRLVNRVG